MDKKKNVADKPKCIKSILRNTEVKVDKTKKNVVKGDYSKCNQRYEENEISCQVDSKFSRPRMNSTKVIAKQIEKLENMDYDTYEKITYDEQSKKIDNLKIREKVTKKANFQLDERLYKNLVALNLNDSNSIPKRRSKSPHRKTSLNSNRDIEPKLEDFYEEKRPLDKPIILPPIKIKMKPITMYNGKDFYDKICSWQEN